MVLNIPPTLSQIRGVGALSFIADGSALASSSKTQAYSDGNAGSLFVRVPTAKMVQGLVNSSILLNLGRAFNTVADTNWAIGAFGTGANTGTNSASGIGAVGTATYYNQATGGSHQFSTNGVNCVSFTDSAQRFYTAGTESAHFDSSGLTTNKNIYFNGAGTASSTLTTQWADAANGNLFCNVPTGKYEQHRVAGQSILKLGNNTNGTAANYWEIGDSTGPSSYVRGSGVDMVHYAATNYYESTTHRFCNSSAVESARITSIVGFLEAGKISLGGTIGSSTDPGAGGLYLTGSSNIRGGQKVAVSTKTTTYTATSSDYIILGNHASTPFTINLPAATGSGQVFIIKNINTAAVTVDANASETIDGSLTQVLATNNSITIVDYATGLWAII